MNWGSWLLWGFVATLALTTVMAGSQGLRLTRMNIPYMLGAMFTPSRDRAKLIGFGVHVLNGWLFSLLYVAAFHAWGRATQTPADGGGKWASPSIRAARRWSSSRLPPVS